MLVLPVQSLASAVNSFRVTHTARSPSHARAGDDYPGWPGVRAAVATLIKTKCLPGTEVHLLEQKWWLYRRECPELAKWIPAQTPE